ncbi:MAG: hydroxysqualene dehydroxylase HpnE [Candidatus Cybelea sp.]
MVVQRVAVVGGGLAGLAAGLALKASGAHVELFERSRILGGRATSFEIDGVEVDNGQHVFLACCTEFVDFATAVGMNDRIHLQERFDATILSRSGKSGRLRTAALPAPLHLIGSFASYSHLGLAGKLRIARALAAALIGQPRANETFEAWLTRNGQGAQERAAFWDPFFIPALNAPFDRVGASDAMFVLKTAFLRDAGAARFGFSKVPLAHLAAAAAKKLDAVHTSTPVTGVTVSASSSDGVYPERSTVIPSEVEGQARVTLSLSKGDGGIPFDAVVLAVGPRQAERILGDPARYGVANLDKYDPYPIIDVHLWHDGGTIGRDFVAALESPLQWIFEKEPGYLCCSFSAADEYLRQATAGLESLAWREAQTFLPSLKSATLIRSAVTRNPEATWLPRVGATRTLQRTNHPAIAVAGSWTETGWPDTMESAVRSGNLAAVALLSRPSSFDSAQDDTTAPRMTK